MSLAIRPLPFLTNRNALTLNTRTALLFAGTNTPEDTFTPGDSGMPLTKGQSDALTREPRVPRYKLVVPERQAEVMNWLKMMEIIGMPLAPLLPNDRSGYRQHLGMVDHALNNFPLASTLQEIRDQYYDAFEVIESHSQKLFKLRMTVKVRKSKPSNPTHPDIRYHGLHLLIFGPNGAFEHWRLKTPESIDIRPNRPVDQKARTAAFTRAIQLTGSMQDWLNAQETLTGKRPSELYEHFEPLYFKLGSDLKNVWGKDSAISMALNQEARARRAHALDHPAARNPIL